jgi:indole-3-glycerol phosphate synthase
VSVTATADLLQTIVAAARRLTSVRETKTPLAALERSTVRRPRGPAFEAALAGGGRANDGPRVIAECKRRSPSKGILREAYDPAAHARAYRDAGAAAISVLTEPTFFDGAPEHLREVRAAVDLPILRKDFIVSEYQLAEAAALGADAALLIVGALEAGALARLIADAERRGLAALVEVHDLGEMRIALDAGARTIGVNSRNLRTLAVDLAVLDAVGAALPDDVVAVAESGIRTAADLDRLAAIGYDAFLVGERLIAAPDPGAALRELRGR